MRTKTTDPAVWIGCLACYNAGRLTGDWYQATEADEVTPAQLHGGVTTTHEELWVMDHEYLPIDGECSPQEAAKMARHLEEADEHLRQAFTAWISEGSYPIDGDNMPDYEAFIDRYCGHWDSFSDYAQHLADDIGLLSEVPEEIARYFNWKSWTEDLEHDYTSVRAAEGGVYVFRDH